MQITVKEIEFYVRQMPMRMPFKFGNVVIDSQTALHVAMDVELASGQRARGWAADMLAPRWFDKDPHKSVAQGIRDLVDGAQAAAEAYRGAGCATAFAIWCAGYEAGRVWGAERGVNPLLASNGGALMERALIDGLGLALGQSYFAILQGNVLGLALGEIHPELKDVELGDVLPAAPLRALHIRHTVGLVDPIRSADIAAAERLDDGLPQSLEEYITLQGIRYLKIKIGGDPVADYDRLADIAALLDGVNCRITLDGNEQYRDAGDLLALLERVERHLGALYDSVLYIEQPLDRAISLDPSLAEDIRVLADKRPMLIDESDDELDTFRRALDLGYTGVSSKSCKGLIKALANYALVQKRNAEGHACFITAEDLTTVPVVSLQQDLVHVAALGIDHLERNGHHYVRGLDHLSESERGQCLTRNGDLYQAEGESGFLAIRGGRMEIGSLQTPGLGVAGAVDAEAMQPLESRLEELA
ncbi:MAG: enolase C-terminal domain-like protein [Candidatus Latescibacterota bacterium]|nr:enolase C-terminal domain-like protein [Candidatus Latescibacterota bacterium]